MGRRVSGVRSPGKQQGSGIAEPGTGTDRNRRPEQGKHCKDLTKGDSVTGSNIAHGDDSQLERISLNHTHPQTPAHTHAHAHAHTKDKARMGPGAHEP